MAVQLLRLDRIYDYLESDMTDDFWRSGLFCEKGKADEPRGWVGANLIEVVKSL